MNDINRIEVGDTVRIALVSACFTGKVLYMPQATGDVWIIRTIPDEHLGGEGELHYVQTFDFMTLLRKRK